MLGVGFGGALAWASMAEIAGAVIAAGSVEVEARLQAIQHRDGGIVAAIPVRDGARVAAGESSLELDGSELAAEEALLARQLQVTRARVDRLSAEERDTRDIVFRDASAAAADPVGAAILADERRLYLTRREVLRQTMAQLAERREQTGAWVDGMRRQAEATRRQLALVEEEARAKEQLFGKGMATKPEVSRLLREEARLEGEIGELEAEIARGRSAAAGYEIERLRLVADWRQQVQSEMRTLQPREAELAGRLRVMQTRLGRLVLRAPMAGVVHGLRVFTVGGVIAPGTEVASIVPEGVPLVLRVRVEAGQIDEVQPGQEVTVVFPSFNARTAPEFTGRVRTVSADALVEEGTGARFYTAEIALTEDSETAARTFGVLPGMPVEAFIQTRMRTPVAFLLDPFTDYVRHAFREE